MLLSHILLNKSFTISKNQSYKFILEMGQSYVFQIDIKAIQNIAMSIMVQYFARQTVLESESKAVVFGIDKLSSTYSDPIWAGIVPAFENSFSFETGVLQLLPKELWIL